MAAGAVYKPDAEMVPIVALPPVIPLTCQVTLVLLVFTIVAVNCWEVPTVTLVGGETEMPMLEICELPISVGTKRWRTIRPFRGQEATRSGSALLLPHCRQPPCLERRSCRPAARTEARSSWPCQ